MESKRQQKFSRLIQRDLSDIFQKEGTGFFGGALVTVTIVRMTPDLGLAKVFLSILPEAKEEEVMKIVDASSNQIRKALGNKIKNQVRKVPEIRFYIDNTEREVSKMNALFDKLDMPPASEEDQDSKE